MITAMFQLGVIAVIGALVAAAAPVALAADDVKEISTGGEGNLTNCSYSGCNLYHHIKLPPHIAVGDKVGIWFGSNPKHYRFPVGRIVHDGDACTIFGQVSETENVDKIDVLSCQVTPATQ